jgi:hypothetical protein
MFICTYKPQQHGQRPATLKRGHAQVYDDGKIYEYHVPKGERRAFRSWLAEAFAMRGRIAKITGAYPHYEIEQR